MPPDFRTQDPDNSGAVLLAMFLGTFGFTQVLWTAVAPDTAIGSSFFGMLCAVGSTWLFTYGLSTPHIRREPQADGSLRVSCRGGTVVSIVFSIFIAVVAWMVLGLVGGLVGVTANVWSLFAVAIAATVEIVRQTLKYATVMTLKVRPGALRPGGVVDLKLRVTAPFGVYGVQAQLVVEEQADDPLSENRTKRTHQLYEACPSADGTIALPASLPGTQIGVFNRICWRLDISAAVVLGPGFTLELPVEARGGPVGEVTARDELAPIKTPSGPAPAIALRGGEHGFVPGETIAGEIVWTGRSQPRRSTLRLVCVTSGAMVDRQVVRAPAVTRMPRVTSAVFDDPYRSTGAEDSEAPAVALAADERRRFRIVAPDGPYSYAGQVLAIAWWLELEVDGDTVCRVPLVIGPGRAALVSRAGDGVSESAGLSVML